jgi:hypothetical protein
MTQLLEYVDHRKRVNDGVLVPVDHDLAIEHGPYRYKHGWIPVNPDVKRSRKQALADEGDYKTITPDYAAENQYLTPAPSSLDAKTLNWYSGSLAQPMNGSLRRGERKYDEQATKLDNSMSELRQNTLLFRTVPPAAFGITGDGKVDEIEKDLGKLVGQTVSDAGFLSTSFKSENGMIKNQKIIMKIRAPKGTHAIYTRPYSNYPQESEILVHRGAKMKITHVERVSGDYGDQIVVHGELAS